MDPKSLNLSLPSIKWMCLLLVLFLFKVLFVSLFVCFLKFFNFYFTEGQANSKHFSGFFFFFFKEDKVNVCKHTNALD